MLKTLKHFIATHTLAPFITTLFFTILLIVSIPGGKNNKATDEDMTDNETTAIELQLWEQEESQSQRVIIQRWVQEFHKQYPEVTIRPIHYQTEALRTQFINSSIASHGPSLLLSPSDVSGIFAAANVIQPVESFIDLEKFNPVSIKAVEINGKIMGVPLIYGNHLMLFYNKKLIDTPPTTSDELIRMAQKHTDIAQKKFGLTFPLTTAYWFVPFLGGFGGWPLTQEGSQVSLSLNTPAMIGALSFLQDLKFKYKVTPTECDFECARGLFLEGQTPFNIDVDSIISSYSKKFHDNLGIAPLPIISQTGKRMTPMVSGRYIYINSHLTKRQRKYVQLFINYLISKKTQVETALSAMLIPGTLEAQNDPEILEQPLLKDVLLAAQYGKAMPANMEMRAFWDACGPILTDIVAGKLTPQEGALLMQQKADANNALLKK